MAEMTEKLKGVERRKSRDPANDNVVFVGKKPTMSYVLAVMTQFSSGCKEVHLKARGNSIITAINVAEVVKNRFSSNLTKKIETDTEKVRGKDGNEMNVSCIDITLNNEVKA